ncbi:unnamed protein product [Owenia fusiformis]|uniref:Uncharacterized protein n=1 Tax=Owenia fusiformis TaxID=6347 RepID=A0A8J1TV24_OWEFU|nr:unnamed protein product [Owenia fusiformis]
MDFSQCASLTLIFSLLEYYIVAARNCNYFSLGQSGARLDGFTISTTTIPTMTGCVRICLSEPNCQSFSYSEDLGSCRTSNMISTVLSLSPGWDYFKMEMPPDLPPPKKVRCPSYPRVQGGDVVDETVEPVEGNILTYRCRTGFYQIKSNKVTCQKDGRWSEAPLCLW